MPVKLAKPYHPWWCLLERTTIIVKKKFQKLFMERHHQVGWTKSCFQSGFQSNFLSMLFHPGHCYCYYFTLHSRVAEMQQVVIFCIPHTTVDSQPLDASCFKPLKSNWVDVCCKSSPVLLRLKIQTQYPAFM